MYFQFDVWTTNEVICPSLSLSPKVNSSFRLSETGKTDKAAGLDNIPGKLLKEAAPVVASSLWLYDI